VIVGIIRRKPVLTYASIIFGNMLASVNSVNSVNISAQQTTLVPVGALWRNGWMD